MRATGPPGIGADGHCSGDVPPDDVRPRRVRRLLAAAVVAVGAVLVIALAVRTGGAAPPPPRPLEAVRASLGAPEPGPGLSAVLRVEQSVVPGAFLGRVALPTGEIRGRMWVRSADAWRVELQGPGHDWNLAREGGLVRLYSSASQTCFVIGVDELPGAIAGIGPTGVAGAEPGTVAGRPVHRVTYRPRGEGLLIESITVAVDAATGVPLALEVRSTRRRDPVLTMTATRVEEEDVPAERVRVRAPENGTTVPLGALLGVGRDRGAVEVRGGGWGRAFRLSRLPDSVGGVLDALGGERDRSAPAPAGVETPLLSVVADGDAVLAGPLTLAALEALRDR